jgi:H+/Cl- antiporter ClcA
MIRSRLPSGRSAREQPNVTDEGEARLTPLFGMTLAVAAVVTGLFGGALMFVLYSVEHLAFGFDSGTFENASEHATVLRRFISLGIAGVVAGIGWYLLRRYVKGASEVDESVWAGDGTLSFRRSLGTSFLSEIVIGMGASLGREAAPKLMGGACGSVLARWTRLSAAQKRLLVACAGGAGLAAVYNVPLSGALFTAEVLIGSMSLPVILPALACSWLATLVSWYYLAPIPTYPNVPAYGFSASLMVWSLLAAPVIGLLAVGFIRMIGWISHHRPTGRLALVAPVGAFLLLAVAGIWLPQLFGNGKGIARDALLGHSSLVLLAVLFVLKPIVTTLCLGSGASGGLFTPTMSAGAALGGALGIAWSLLWPGSPAGAFAMVGAAAMIGAAMQAPLAAVALVLELTHSGFEIMVPMIAATVLATAVARQVDGYSIYSARLAYKPPTP